MLQCDSGTNRIVGLNLNHTVIAQFLFTYFQRIMTVLWATGEVGVMILIFALVDATAATWTMLTMRRLTHAEAEINS